jgi:hypothetical protein
VAPALLMSPAEAGKPKMHAASVATKWADVWAATPDRSVVVQDAQSLDGLWGYHDLLRKRSRIFVMNRVEPDWRALLDALFSSVITGDQIQAALPVDQLAEVLESPDRADLVIAAAATPHAVVLYRGDLESLVVPCEWFSSQPTAKPDFGQLSITDYGQTIRLGDYEVATEAVLYERDPEYRRRLKARKILKDNSFGGALRRLRLQKGLRRSDFPGLSEKELARIERGEIDKPQERTLKILSRRLGVDPAEIASY